MDYIKGLQAVLDQLYSSMLSQSGLLITTSQLAAAIATLCYGSMRIIRHLTRAEAIDLYPFWRPVALSIAITFFPTVITLFNGLLSPVTAATQQMQTTAAASIDTLLQLRQEALKGTTDYQMYIGANGAGDESVWEKYSGEADSGMLSGVSNAMRFALAKASFSLRNSVREWLSQALELLYESAALCINTLRTFNLLVLAILGPLVLALSIFDGFHDSLRDWLARYIHVYLWLPVANIFGTILANIQGKMLQLDIGQIQANGHTTFGATNTGYMIFLIIGITGYFTIPSVAGYIVRAGTSHFISGRIKNR